MMIDPNKTYRTRDGRPVRIYAVDGGITQELVHGAVRWETAWEIDTWDKFGCKNALVSTPTDLVEMTLADELRDQIPWEALRPRIRYVAMDGDGNWFGGDLMPSNSNPRIPFRWDWEDSEVWGLGCVEMPLPRPSRWFETLISRPEGR